MTTANIILQSKEKTELVIALHDGYPENMLHKLNVIARFKSFDNGKKRMAKLDRDFLVDATHLSTAQHLYIMNFDTKTVTHFSTPN